MTSSANNYPEFFIIFLPEKHSERMIIPNAFLEFTRLKESLPEDVILRDCRSGRVWHVKARFIDDKLLCLEFDDGSKQFQEENNLKAADFLIFNYDGNNEFKFKIFDLASGCERMNLKEDEVHGSGKDNMMMLEEGEKIKEEAEEICEYKEMREEEEHEDNDFEMEEEEEEEEDNDSEDDSDDEYDDTEIEESEEEYNGNKRSQCNSRASKASVIHKRSTARTSTTKAEDPELGDCEAEAELCVNPLNPYFFAKVHKRRPNQLHIPGNIITVFSLSFPEKIRILCCQCKNVPRNEVEAYHQSLPQQTLLSSERRELTGKISRWKDGQVWVQGWEKFSRKHRIKENNVCICEIVQGEDQNVKMLLVHVRCVKKL